MTAEGLLEVEEGALRDPLLVVWILGTPEPAGSKRYLGRTKAGKGIVADDNPDAALWKRTVQLEVRQAMLEQGRAIERGPLLVAFTFRVRRPRAHYRTGKNAGKLHAWAPAYPTGRPDALKLARAVEDALTGILYVDDAQSVTLRVAKRYAWDDREGVLIRVWRLPSVTPPAAAPPPPPPRPASENARGGAGARRGPAIPRG